MLSIRRSRRPEALPQGVSSPDLPDGRKVIGLLSQTDQTEPEVEPAVSREAVRRDARAASFALGGISPSWAMVMPDRSLQTAIKRARIAAPPQTVIQRFSWRFPRMRHRNAIRSWRLVAQCGNVRSIAYLATRLCALVGRGELAEQTPNHSSTPDENEQLMKAVRFIAG
jgi:hypothetical protein